MKQENLSAITAPLVAWYRANKRPLPWRQDRQPYHVWISEIMLQQTRIEAVMSYYQRFMQALPTVESLSQISEEQLLKLWEGLGYYSRARNLKKAAEIIVNEYDGVFPDNYEALRKLPGIGEYTAGAIASICFNEPVPAVDGNVLRVLSRLTGSRENVLLPEVKKEATRVLTAVMPPQAGDFNEGLMELGEIICLPNGAPLCAQCPLQAFCTAYQENTMMELPVRIKNVKRKKEEKTVLLLQAPDGRIALEKRDKKGLLAGMYQLPNVSTYLTEPQITAQLAEWGLQPLAITALGSAKHVFTHIDWLMQGWAITVAASNDRFIWVTPQQLSEQYPLPTAFRYFVKDV